MQSQLKSYIVPHTILLSLYLAVTPRGLAKEGSVFSIIKEQQLQQRISDNLQSKVTEGFLRWI